MVMTAERNLGAKLRSASRVEAARLPRLKQICKSWADGLSRALAADFETSATVEYAGAGNTRFGSVEADQPAPVLCLQAGSPGWNQPVLVLCDARLADIATEILMGGDGARALPDPRKPTALDLRLSRLLLDHVLAHGNQCLGTVMDVAMTSQRLLTEAVPEKLGELFSGGPQDYVLLRFRLALGRGESFVEVALPESVLALHRRTLDHLPAPDAPAPDESWARNIEDRLQHADMHLVALLDEKAMTLGEIAGLAIGQTLVLNTKVDSLITVECEDQRLFRGHMGRGRESYLVRIEEKIDPTEEFIDDILSD